MSFAVISKGRLTSRRGQFITIRLPRAVAMP